jgi:hypothetical protein
MAIEKTVLILKLFIFTDETLIRKDSIDFTQSER